MMNIMDYIELAKSFFVAVIFGFVNILMRPALPSAFLYFTELFISITFATLIGVLLTETSFSPSVSYACTAASALLARDMLSFIVGFGDYVNDNKDAVYKKMFAYFINNIPKRKKDD